MATTATPSLLPKAREIPRSIRSSPLAEPLPRPSWRGIARLVLVLAVSTRIQRVKHLKANAHMHVAAGRLQDVLRCGLTCACAEHAHEEHKHTQSGCCPHHGDRGPLTASRICPNQMP